MRIVSFNVNGLRSFSSKIDIPFNNYISDVLQADILCIQETKGSSGSLDAFHSLKDYATFSSFHSSHGRHGVSTFVRKSLFCGSSVEIEKGRILRTSHGGFVIYNCYLPFLDAGSSTEIKTKQVLEIYQKLENSAKEMLNKKDTSEVEIIICGDLNACYSILDHYQYIQEYKQIIKNSGHAPIKVFDQNFFGNYENTTASNKLEKLHASPRELPWFFGDLESLEGHFFSVPQRAWMKRLTKDFIDTFRLFENGLNKYTCWNTLLNNRPRNLGTRIDYILCSRKIECIDSGILPNIFGSDHCPVYACFKINTDSNGKKNLARRKNNLLDFIK